MSDNKNFEDEYQYVEEPDNQAIDIEAEPIPEPKEEPSASSSFATNKFNDLLKQPSIKRNALIAVFALFMIIFLLKCAARPMTKPDSDEIKPIPIKPMASNINKVANSVSLQNNEMQNLIEMQSNMQSNLAAMNDKVNSLTAQLNTLNSNNQILQQQIGQLLSKLQSMQQSMEEAIASAKSRPQIKSTSAHTKIIRHYAPGPKINYFVQAIIPGRAWLVSSQGKTITVRVGSILPGYGKVRTIDAQQGRVLMSSSKVFVFSQAD